MKKKVLVVMMAACLALGMTACGGGDSDKKEEKKTEDSKKDKDKEDSKDEEKETKVEAINIDNSDASVVFSRFELTKDYEGADALRVYFTYTNKSDETKSGLMATSVKLFQNGVECESAISSMDDQNEAQDNIMKEIMKDNSLEIAYLFKLQDVTTPVLLKVTDLSSENLMKDVYQEQDIALQ